MTEKINLSLSKETTKGQIDLGFEYQGKIVVKEKFVPLDMNDLVTELIILGLARKTLARTGTAFIIFNPEDTPDLDFDSYEDYDCSG
jgi:hypothetical protein